MARKQRSYVFTINNYTDEEYEAIQGMECRYLIVGKEVGAEGTPHLQGYILFRNARSFNTIKRLLPRAHIEPAKGNAEQNIDYCSKDGDYFEKGDRPVSQKRKGEAEKQRWEDARSAAKEGRLDDIDADIYVRQYRTLKMIKKDHMQDIPDHDDVTGIWFYGAAGTGKSRTARQDYPGAYLKMCNKWWDGYNNEDNVIIDDFDKNHSVLGHHLKIWADRYAFIAETKGGAVKIRPKKIIVTSQYHITDIWDDCETREALQRRFSVTHFN
jgi:hypothetical protein